MSAKPKKERTRFHKTINWVVSIVITLLVIFILLFGFSQTQTFREYLRDTITEQVDSTINGKLSIKSIEGSIFTSLKLNEILLESRYDTIAYAKRIELHISPLQILLKKIYVRSIIGDSIRFNLVEVKPGVTNLASLSKDSGLDSLNVDDDSLSVAEDESDSEFPFVIQINNIEFTNLSFIQKSFEHANSNNSYEFANFDDLVLTNINLKSKALLDIAKSDFQFVINYFMCNTNIDNFNIRSLAGAFHVSNKFFQINKFNLITDSSNISLDTKVSDLNLFSEFDLADFKDNPVNLNLKVKPFAFFDLSRFLPDLDFLKGDSELEFVTKGKFGELLVDKLVLNYAKSNFNVSGLVKNLNTPENLFFDVEFSNSKSNFNDINTLLPALELPNYSTLNLSDFNLKYSGEPTKFNASFNGKVGKGKLQFDSKLDMSGADFIYDIIFKTDKLDITEVLETNCVLTTEGKLKGKGTDPSRIEAVFRAKAFKSNVNDYLIDSLFIDVTANSKIIQLDFKSIINNANTLVNGRLDLTNDKVPVYNLTGSFGNLDLSKFIGGDDYESSLNFQFVADGEGLQLDDMTGSFNLGFDESMLKSNYFDKADVELKLTKEGAFREIDLISDFVDFTITGEFLLEEAVELLTYQSVLTRDIISRKVDELNPITFSDTLLTEVDSIIDTAITNKNLKFEFEFEFKDFDLIALLIDQEELGIEGFGSGDVVNTPGNFSINADLELDHFYTLRGADLLYLSNLETNLNFTKDNSSNSFNNLFGALSVGSERIVAGSIIKNFTADFIFNQSKLIYNLSTDVDTFLTSTIDGSMELMPGDQILEIDNVVIDYKNTTWKNSEQLVVEISNDSLLINNFKIYNESAYIKLDGIFTGNEQNNLIFEVGNLPGNLLTYYAFDMYDKNFSAISKLKTKIKGTLDKPKIDLDFQINKIVANNNNLGNFQLVADYFDNNLNVRFDFLDSLFNYNKPYFTAIGSIPLVLDSDTNAVSRDSLNLFNISFIADSFDVATIGNIIPAIRNQKGYLDCKLDVSGYKDKIEYVGSLKLSQITYRVLFNNLEYKTNALFNFNRDEIVISDLSIANLKGSRIQGKLNGKGKVKLKGFAPDQIDITVNGGLGVLGFRSRSVSPAVYGNLFIEARDEWKYSYKNKLSRFDGDVLLKEMDLIYAPIQTGYSSNKEVIYEFKVDSSKIDKEELKFDRLIMQKTAGANKRSKSEFDNFDYLFNFRIEDQAKIDFILSSSFNQKLSVLADGDMRFASVGGQSSAQGQFNLREGSKLEFFKVLDAEGFIRFDANIADPFLKIIATYKTIYNEPGGALTPVAVKINIDGNYSELGKNLASKSDNIRVFSGQRNNDDNIADQRYDAKNALSFILIGKPNFTLGTESSGTFADDIAVEAAASFLGSTLTSLLNSRIGDAINDVKFQRLAADQNNYRFDVSGKFQNVRYSLGGTTKNFDNLYRANLKIEYLFNENFLIRAERKSPLRDITDEAAKISELGLRYIFVF